MRTPKQSWRPIGKSVADPVWSFLPASTSLFLQIKQAVPSVYERFVGDSPYSNHGQRMINGQRMIQSATDMFVGWTTNGGHDFYVRQLRDGKVIPKGETITGRLAKFAAACGRVLARTRAQR